jgi:DNA-binding PadR family transcriptional regulator
MSNVADLQELVITILAVSEEGHDREMTGSEIFRELSQKGVETWQNHVYTLLTKMEENGLLKSRWVENANGRGPRKHLYRLGKIGEERRAIMIKDSAELLMSEFFRTNSKIKDLKDHIAGLRKNFALAGKRTQMVQSDGNVIVMTIPYYDPLICHPVSINALAEAFPKSLIYVIKPKEMKFASQRENLKLLDGSRSDLPLKDEFADYLLLEGFPKEAPLQTTLSECERVLKPNASLGIQISEVMIKERRPAYVSFAEFVTKTFYETCAQDTMVSLNELRSLLRKDFSRFTETKAFGNIVIWAMGLTRKVRSKPAERLELTLPDTFGREITVPAKLPRHRR